jgi:hypothetical protein
LWLSKSDIHIKFNSPNFLPFRAVWQVASCESQGLTIFACKKGASSLLNGTAPQSAVEPSPAEAEMNDFGGALGAHACGTSPYLSECRPGTR